MIFKKLLEKFDTLDMQCQEELEIAQKIAKKFDLKICKQSSDAELKIMLQAILYIIFVSHGMPPAIAFLFSKIISRELITKIKQAEEIFDFLKAKYVSE